MTRDEEIDRAREILTDGLIIIHSEGISYSSTIVALAIHLGIGMASGGFKRGDCNELFGTILEIWQQNKD
ncbi:MAG: hypothetical protein KGI54_09580 [Pseudomonadota bacterium]|nr:hypothetical protein [Pseudomonadota bacterium]